MPENYQTVSLSRWVSSHALLYRLRPPLEGSWVAQEERNR